MKRKEVSLNLAESLTLGEWTRPVLESMLNSRLPQALHHLIPELAATLAKEFRSPYAPAKQKVAEFLSGHASVERIYKHCTKHDIWPSPDLSLPKQVPIAAFRDLELPELLTLADLADWLMLPMERFLYLADMQNRAEAHDDQAVNHYHYILKKKRNGSYRVIEAPKQSLKAVQRHILRNIIDKLPSHEDAFGFVKGRNCLQSAGRHSGEQTVLRFDLHEFFPSTGAGRVMGIFRCLGYPHSVAQHLTALCVMATPPRVLARLPFEQRETYRMPHLPQGSPVSPSLANHIAFSLDRRLAGLARRLDANYSRYADDLIFSGDPHITATLLKAVPDIVRSEGFVLNPLKTRVMPSSAKQKVTGMIVNQHLNIDRKRFDHLKAVIHRCAKPMDTRLADPQFRASLQGQIDWVASVNPGRGAKLQALLGKAVERRAG